jgi:hypothetical protein
VGPGRRHAKDGAGLPAPRRRLALLYGLRSPNLYASLPANIGPDFEPVLSQRRSVYSLSLPVATYTDCFINHSGLAVTRLRLRRETAWPGLSPQVARHLRIYALYKFLTQRRLRVEAPNLLLIHNHWSAGYHHWLTECLPKLRFLDSRRYLVLVPADHPAFCEESLAYFRVAGIVRIPRAYGVSATQVTTVGNPISGRFNPSHMRWLRAKILAACGDSGRSPERIYISRRQERLRRVVNEAEVSDLLRRYGFAIVEPDKLTFQQQAALFSRCRCLISIHGAGLTNCIFMPEGARVLELYRALNPGRDMMNTCYWHLSSAVGLTYYYQFCKHGRQHRDDIDRIDVEVDLRLLEHNVQLMLER